MAGKIKHKNRCFFSKRKNISHNLHLHVWWRLCEQVHMDKPMPFDFCLSKNVKRRLSMWHTRTHTHNAQEIVSHLYMQTDRGREWKREREFGIERRMVIVQVRNCFDERKRKSGSYARLQTTYTYKTKQQNTGQCVYQLSIDMICAVSVLCTHSTQYVITLNEMIY